MKFSLKYLNIVPALAIACPAVAQTTAPAPAGSAEERIERIRKGDVVITVVDPAGNRLPGVKLTIEQKRHAFLFGCNIFNWGGEADRYRKGMAPELQDAYRERFRDLFNFATLPFYFHYYNPEPDRPRHAYMRELVSWCRQNDLVTKGHPLVYNFLDPVWATDDIDDLRRRQEERVAECVARFKGLIDIWDVVNEASFINLPDRKKGAPKLTAMWNKANCLPFAKKCFEVAREANPEATLLINDYILDKRYEEVVGFLGNGNGRPLYDAIGIQSHMHTGTWTDEKAWAICEQYAKFKVPIHITETTVLSGMRSKDGSWPSTPAAEAWQAREVARIYTLFFSHPAVEAITWWDLADGYAWQGAPAGLLHGDLSPKPAYETLMQLIKEQWWTREELTTGADGTVVCRGFYGDYRVASTAPGRTKAEQNVSLKKGERNEWKIVLDK